MYAQVVNSLMLKIKYIRYLPRNFSFFVWQMNVSANSLLYVNSCKSLKLIQEKFALRQGKQII